MRVLLLGGTGKILLCIIPNVTFANHIQQWPGNVGSRLIPALHAHNHQVDLYVRTPSKLPQEARSLASTITAGSGTDSDAIKAAILDNNCDAVINAAGIANMFSSTGGEFPAIFAAVVKAVTEAGQERGKPLRAWFLSGWSLLDSPKPPHLIMD